MGSEAGWQAEGRRCRRGELEAKLWYAASQRDRPRSCRVGGRREGCHGCHGICACQLSASRPVGPRQSMAPHPNATPATPQSPTTATSADAGRDERVESHRIESSRVKSGRTCCQPGRWSVCSPACPPPLRDDNAYCKDGRLRTFGWDTTTALASSSDALVTAK